MRSRLISYENALDLAISAAKPLDVEQLAFVNALNCVLAKPIFALFDLPRFDNSAVDGFGVHLDDLERLKANNEVQLEIVKTIAAGNADLFTLNSGQTVHIMTGAKIPSGVAAVVMQEHVVLAENNTIILDKELFIGENIRSRGEELKSGEEFIAKDSLISPAVIAAAASIGKTELVVYKKPRIGLLITGNELILSGKLNDSQIYESNSHGLIAALQNIGLKPSYISYVKDDLGNIEGELKELLSECDVIISTGGVSVGKYDFIRSAIEKIGARFIFSGVAIKPGKPVSLAKFKESKFIFALPGNPMATLVVFYALVAPFLRSILGFGTRNKYKKAILTTNLRKKIGRLAFIPGEIADDEQDLVTPLSKQGPQMLSGLAKADCLIVFPSELDVLNTGDQVNVLQFKDFQ